ncbi:GNAT family N-acetyltransferase [Archangium sp.]|uniref:GNAT family N-acetyltransferase n=1 Tax=Archangium sp. TaxID=1872627 RepID=UPI00286D041E|nr:GNAT family N-acetyltransferase [Archangium sp.]
MHIRNAEGGDAAAYVSYMNEIGGESDYLTFGLNEYGRTVAEVAGMIASMSAKTNELFLLAFITGRVVGALMLESGQRPRVRHAAELSITVRREYWSRGVGPALMDRCRQWLEETRTLSKVNLRVREDHARAIRLYEKKGFVTEGLTTRALYVNGQYYGVRHMGLTLDL